MTTREPPQPCIRSGGHEAVKPCREGVGRHRRAAVPWVREDRVAHLPREHGTVTRGIMTSQSAASPGALPDEQRGEREEAAGAARVAWCHSADIV